MDAQRAVVWCKTEIHKTRIHSVSRSLKGYCVGDTGCDRYIAQGVIAPDKAHLREEWVKQSGTTYILRPCVHYF